KVRDDGVAAVLRHRNEVICDGLVLLQFDLFWIDHHELQIGRMARVQEPGDKRIQPDRLARASGAGNQLVRELGEVLHEDLPLDGLADGDGKLHFRIAEARRTNYIPNLNQLPVTVGDLHADRRLPRDGRNHPDAFGRHGHSQVVLERGDAADLYPWSRRELIKRHGRSDDRIDATDLDVIGLEDRKSTRL